MFVLLLNGMFYLLHYMNKTYYKKEDIKECKWEATRKQKDVGGAT